MFRGCAPAERCDRRRRTVEQLVEFLQSAAPNTVGCGHALPPHGPQGLISNSPGTNGADRGCVHAIAGSASTCREWFRQWLPILGRSSEGMALGPSVSGYSCRPVRPALPSRSADVAASAISLGASGLVELLLHQPPIRTHESSGLTEEDVRRECGRREVQRDNPIS